MRMLCGLMLLALVLSVVQAGEAKTEIPKADADGWITLFNGKDLTGWEGLEGHWSVVDGAIQCRSGKGGTLFTEKEYGDFIVYFEYKHVIHSVPKR